MSSTKLTVQEEEEIREKLRIMDEKKLLDQYKRLGFSQFEVIDHAHDCKDHKKVIEGDECKTCGGLRVSVFKKSEKELLFFNNVELSRDDEYNRINVGELDDAIAKMYEQIDKAAQNVNEQFKDKVQLYLSHPDFTLKYLRRKSFVVSDKFKELGFDNY